MGSGTTIDWGTIIGVTITGLVVVFIALILLIIIITIMGKILDSKNNTPKEQAQQTATTAKTEPVPEKKTPPVIQSGITGETVAAISAAVSCVMDKPVSIKSISKATPAPTTSRSVWRLAGITDNTRPF